MSNIALAFKEKMSVRKIIFLIIGALVILAGAYYLFLVWKPWSHKAAVQTQRTSKAARGDLTVIVSGSGSLASSSKTDISSTVATTVKKINYRDGDSVKEGDVIMVLDDTDSRDSLAKVEKSISDAIQSNEPTRKSIENLVVRAPFSGYVSNLTAKLSDTLSKGANILTLTDEANLKVLVQFGSLYMGSIKNGQPVKLNFSSFTQSVGGVVTYVVGNSYSTSTGGAVFDVEVSLVNPGAFKEGMKASAEINTDNGVIKSEGEGALEYINKQVIKTDSGGTVKTLNVRSNQFVSMGDVILELQNDDLDNTNKSNESKLADLYTQRDKAVKQVDSCTVKAPSSGVISGLTLKVGDTAKSGQVLCTVFDKQHMEFNIAVDELDITKISLGQRASVTIDALPDTQTRPMNAKIAAIAATGTSQNGVSTYPVTISLDASEQLKPGMNANAEIYVTSKQNILLIPIEAVQKIGNRTFVYVKGESSTSPQPSSNNQSSTGNGSGNAQGQGQAPGSDTSGANRRNQNGQQTDAQQGGNQQRSYQWAGQQGGSTQGGSTQGGNAPGGNVQSGSVPAGNMQGGYAQAGNVPGGNQQSGNAQNGNVQGSNQQGAGVQGGSYQPSGQQGSSNQRNSTQGMNQQSGTGSTAASRQQVSANNYYKGSTLRQIDVGVSNERYVEVLSGISEGEEVILPPLATAAASAQNVNQQMSGGLGNMGGIGGFGGVGNFPAGGNQGVTRTTGGTQQQQQR